METIYETTGGKYEMQGDYALPSLKVGDEEEYHIGVFGQRYRRHLREQHRILYYNYMTDGTLNRHIAEVDERANRMFDSLVKKLAEKENITEKLKADDPMEWMRKLNNIRSRAMEIVNHDVIYIRRELVTIGLEMGLEEDDSLTPDGSSWANPITASENFQGDNLERALKDYVRSMPNLVIVYGGEAISYFNIYIEPIDGGRYRFYFLY